MYTYIQVEFASVIVINKCDLVTPQHLTRVRKVIRALNGDAKMIEASHSKIDVNEIIGSNTYNFEKVSQSAAWIKVLICMYLHMYVFKLMCLRIYCYKEIYTFKYNVIYVSVHTGYQ
jgi:ribosome biogenesis GTPase A